jgi:hypothetical protein
MPRKIISTNRFTAVSRLSKVDCMQILARTQIEDIIEALALFDKDELINLLSASMNKDNLRSLIYKSNIDLDELNSLIFGPLPKSV